MSPSRPSHLSSITESGLPSDPYNRPQQTFPKLSPEMIERIKPYGQPSSFDGGDYLFHVGDRNVDFFLILEGAVDILESDGHGGHVLIITHETHEFTGELDHLNGRAVLVCARAAQPTKVIRLKRSDFRAMASAEPDIGEIILRAFILRRVGLIQHAEGGILLVGGSHSGDTLRIQSFLTRNGYPHRVLDTDQDADAASALESFHLGTVTLPVAIINGVTVLQNPRNRDLADALGITEGIDPERLYDVAIIGAGPSGLAAAVYAASEGLDTIVIESIGPGGQAGSSSRIENYLGFPTGISGQALAGRAQIQAQKFGARLAVARPAVELECTGNPFRLQIEGSEIVKAKAIVVASGARYRRLDMPNLAQFEGRGIHYAATSIEGRLCVGDDVVVIGGGNSAGQAAIFLSANSKHVHILVRGKSLSDTMSDYLVSRIEQSHHITLHTQCEITALFGDTYLEAVQWRDRDGKETKQRTANLFSMIGAVPNTDWLNGCLATDEKGFVKTGETVAGKPPVSPYETSVPGIFAVGDVRANSVKRVASSVGEGSVVVHSIHGWLANLKAP